MSLTSELKDTESPLSAFMAAEFPRVREFAAAFRAVRPDDAEALPPPAAAGTRVAWGTLNAAIDHRLRYAFSDSRALPETVEHGITGASRLAGPGARAALRRTGADLGVLLEELITVEQPAARAQPLVLPAAAEARLARFCYAMTWFEEVYRTRRLWPGTPLGDAGPGLTVEELLAVVPAYAVEDLVTQAQLASKALGGLRAACPAAQVHAGPDFAGSPDVGGADADLIVGGLLIDVKGTVTPSRLRKPEFYQLLGYALLDYDDEYRINALGFYLSRFGRLITWTVEEYLELLGARETVSQLRQACREALAIG